MHGFACSAGEETPSRLSHMKFPDQFPCSQCASSECPLLSGGEGLLLSQGDKVTCAWDLGCSEIVYMQKTSTVFLACGLVHTSTHLVYKAISR